METNQKFLRKKKQEKVLAFMRNHPPPLKTSSESFRKASQAP